MTVSSTKTIPRVIPVLVAALLLTGCSILPKRSPVQIWQPPETASTPAPTPAAGFSLRVETPNTTGLLDRTGIVVMPSAGEVSTYKGARWSEPPALLVRHRLVDAFMAAGLPAVTTEDDRFRADVVLSGDLRAFQSEYRSGVPVIVVRFDAQVRHGNSREPLATRSFVITAQPAGSQVPAIVAAFGAAGDQLTAQVVPWVIDEVRKAPARDPASATPRRNR